MDISDSSELDWLAFRYIAGELSREEHAAFEARLSEDQQSRDAVVRAVDLAKAIALVECGPVAPAVREQTRRRRQRAASMALAVAGVAIVLGLSLFRPEPAADISVAANVAEAGLLIDFWAESTGVVPATAIAYSEAAAAGEEIDFHSHDDPSGAWDDDQPGLSVPDWMFAAVSAQLQHGDEPLEN